VKVPPATRHLLITCARPRDRQFRAVASVCRMLSACDGVAHLRWAGEPLRLGRRSALRWVAVSGHGAEDAARIGDGRGGGLSPCDLGVASGVDLYLLACSQGREATRNAWAEGTGAAAHGCTGETDSSLSVLFLLGLLDDGPESAWQWFGRWREANDRLRPHFSEMRRLHEALGGSFSAALDALSEFVDLAPLGEVVAVAERHRDLLERLWRPLTD
jgi:hypothetical protein